MFRVLDIDYTEVCVEVELIHDFEDNNDIEYYARLYSEPEQLLDYLGDDDIEVETDDRKEVIKAIKETIKEYENNCMDKYRVKDMHMEIECTEPHHQFDLDDLEWGEIEDVTFRHGDEEVTYTLEKI